MAIPLFVGVGAAVTALVTAVVEAVGKKTLVAGALVAAIFAAYSVLKLTFDTLITGIDAGTPPAWFITGIQLLPSNTDDCIVAICTSMVARMAFDSSMKIINVRAAA